jgi:hypothetical protein
LVSHRVWKVVFKKSSLSEPQALPAGGLIPIYIRRLSPRRSSLEIQEISIFTGFNSEVIFPIV